MVRNAAALAALPVLVLAAAAAGQTQYSIKKVVPPSGDTTSSGRSINADAQIAGSSVGTIEHAYFYDNGSTAALPDLGGSPPISYGFGINAGGDVVGRSSTGSFPVYGERAALWTFSGSSWSVTNLGLLTNHYYSSASAINDTGLIAGYSGDGGNYDYAVVWELSGSQWNIVQLPGITNAFATEAEDVNDFWQVVGWSDGEALLWTRDDDGTWNYSQLGGLAGGDGFSQALGINADGVIVGQAGASDNFRHAVLWGEGGIVDLGPEDTDSAANSVNASAMVVGWGAFGSGTDALRWDASGNIEDLQDLIPPGTGWDLSEAADINDAGQIVGTGTLSSTGHTFLLTPVAMGLVGPVPGTAGTTNGFVVSGAGGAGWVLWYSFSGGETAIGGCGDIPLNLGSPAVLGTASPGVTSMTVSIPGNWSGQTVYFQVAKSSGCAVSNVVRYTFP